MRSFSINRNGSHKIVVSHGANRLAKSSQVPDRLLNKNTLLVFQTETDLKENAKLMKRGKKKGAKVIFNVAPAAALPPKDLLNIDYLIINKPEAEVIAKSERMGVENLPLFAKAMADKFDLMCIVTLGKLGVLAAFPDKDDVISLPSLTVKAIDTVGAGRCVCRRVRGGTSRKRRPLDGLSARCRRRLVGLYAHRRANSFAAREGNQKETTVSRPKILSCLKNLFGPADHAGKKIRRNSLFPELLKDHETRALGVVAAAVSRLVKLLHPVHPFILSL